MEKRETVTLKNGAKVTFITADKLVKHDDLVTPDVLERLHWAQFFDEDFNGMFARFVNSEGEHPFMIDDGEIGIWLTLHDTVTGEEYTGWFFQECVGTIMVALYILMQCMRFVNADGHIYNFMTDSTVAQFYNRFVELIEEESEPHMRRHFTHTGGYLEAVFDCHGYTPEDIFDILAENIY